MLTFFPSKLAFELGAAFCSVGNLWKNQRPFWLTVLYLLLVGEMLKSIIVALTSHKEAMAVEMAQKYSSLWVSERMIHRSRFKDCWCFLWRDASHIS